MVLNDKLVLGLAGLSILVRFRCSQFREFCSKYIMPDCDIVDFEVFVTDERRFRLRIKRIFLLPQAERANQHISDFGVKHSEILSELLTAISL